tara:strand:- start:19046 stop:19294 length:249 start_codon:yes stop_codon:yes gene_type:complete
MFTVVSRDYNTDTYTVETEPCIMCDEISNVEITSQGLFYYNQGKLIQECFPELSIGDRELLITGTHDECFNELYAEEGQQDD